MLTKRACARAQVRYLVDNMRVQMDSRVGEIAGDLRAQPEHANGDPDSFVFKVDAKLLPPAVRAAPLSRISRVVSIQYRIFITGGQGEQFL